MSIYIIIPHYQHTRLSSVFSVPLPLFPSPLSLPLPYKHLFSTKKRSNPSSTTKTGGGGGAVVTGELEVVSWTDLSHCVLLTPTLVKERPYSSSMFGVLGATVNGNGNPSLSRILLRYCTLSCHHLNVFFSRSFHPPYNSHTLHMFFSLSLLCFAPPFFIYPPLPPPLLLLLPPPPLPSEGAGSSSFDDGYSVMLVMTTGLEVAISCPSRRIAYSLYRLLARWSSLSSLMPHNTCHISL